MTNPLLTSWLVLATTIPSGSGPNLSDGARVPIPTSTMAPCTSNAAYPAPTTVNYGNIRKVPFDGVLFSYLAGLRWQRQGQQNPQHPFGTTLSLTVQLEERACSLTSQDLAAGRFVANITVSGGDLAGLELKAGGYSLWVDKHHTDGGWRAVFVSDVEGTPDPPRPEYHMYILDPADATGGLETAMSASSKALALWFAPQAGSSYQIWIQTPTGQSLCLTDGCK